jgi:hypothetical protein
MGMKGLGIGMMTMTTGIEMSMSTDAGTGNEATGMIRFATVPKSPFRWTANPQY